MGDWKSVLRDYAREHNLEWHDTNMGVGLGFSDGYDVFWVLPGEVFSTVHCDMNGPEPDRDLVTEYQAINTIRGQVIHALRHHLAENGFRIQPYYDGDWVICSKKFKLSETVSLGAEMTQLVCKKWNAYQVLLDVGRHQRYVDVISNDAFHAFMQKQLPPENEQLAALRSGYINQLEYDWKNACQDIDVVNSSVELVELTALFIEKMDAFASKQIELFFTNPDHIYFYSQKAYFDSEVDSWCDINNWVALAEWHTKSDHVPVSAVLVLADAGHPKSEYWVKKYFLTKDFEFDVYEDDYRLVWNHRHEFPDVAAKLFRPDLDDLLGMDVCAALERVMHFQVSMLQSLLSIRQAKAATCSPASVVGSLS